MCAQPVILRIAVPSPLQRLFDYLPPDPVPAHELAPGCRVRVPFGRATAVGVLVELASETDIEVHRLKRALEVVDPLPVVDAELMQLARWASQYYQHPLGEVLSTVLPGSLRKGAAAAGPTSEHWCLTAKGQGLAPEQLQRAPRQAALHRLLAENPAGLAREQLAATAGDWRGALRAMAAKGWVSAISEPLPADVAVPIPAPTLRLTAEQTAAVGEVSSHWGRFQAFLLHGVTGSGKTEVYLQLIAATLARGQQAVVLVPEIGLTPQLVGRFRARFQCALAVLHSGLSERERLHAWMAAREGQAPIVIGTRLAVFAPLKRLGLIVVDEEHDSSFKQQEGFRYSARDLALVRAQNAGVPIVLGSATPSLESLHHAREGRYRLLALTERAGAAQHPRMELLDVRSQSMADGLSEPLLVRMRTHLQDGGQVLLFLNRRGYAPTLLCHDCGWVAECRRCDAHMTFHHHDGRLRCHHCGSERRVDPQCPACGSVDLRPVGHGTERMEQALREQFPDVDIVRIDRDSTRRKGSLQAKLERVRQGSPQILLGTQMLAKGHHFPEVTLVGIIDSDQGLFSADFRASERMAQLVLQVAGRAGRAEKPGEVVIQTHHPDHPLLQLLVRQDYSRFAEAALQERREAGLPPYSRLALLRAEAAGRDAPHAFLEDALDKARALGGSGVQLLGPVAPPMERRQGRYRAQLLLQAEQRSDLHRLLRGLVPQLNDLKSARKVRWSVDVDPLDMM